MKIWMWTIVTDIAVAVLCWYALQGVDAAQNILLFLSWFGIASGFMMILKHKDETVRQIIREHSSPHYNVWDGLTDIAFIAVVASLGWYWTAGFLVVTKSFKHGMKRELAQTEQAA